jgi:hypothetical protein
MCSTNKHFYVSAETHIYYINTGMPVASFFPFRLFSTVDCHYTNIQLFLLLVSLWHINQRIMSDTSTKMRRALFKRENTITLSLVESQKNISQLLAKLDETHSGNGDKDFAYVQANISELLGKFEDSHDSMQGDLNDILESFQKGTMSNAEIAELIRNEKERGSMSIQLVQNMQSKLDDVLSFVAHFVTDVESGAPLPKDSFKALFQELDTVAESVHTMGKVVRTPTRRVAEMKKKFSINFKGDGEDGPRGIGGAGLASFFQQQDQVRRNVVREIRAAPRMEEDFYKEPAKPQVQQLASKKTGRTPERDSNHFDKRAGSPPPRTGRPPSSSFRALSRQSSLESEGLSGEEELELTGKKSNFTVKKIQRQASGQQTIRSALVRALTQEMSDDEISYDSQESMANRRAVKVSKNHRQTQTDETITMLAGNSIAAQPGSGSPGKSQPSTRESRVAALPEPLRRQSQAVAPDRLVPNHTAYTINSTFSNFFEGVLRRIRRMEPMSQQSTLITSQV